MEIPDLVDAALHLLSQNSQGCIARVQVRPRIADPDYRPPIEHLFGMALVLGPTARDKSLVQFVAKPRGTAQCFFAFTHKTSLLLSLSYG